MFTPLPIVIRAFADTTVQVQFKPKEVRSYSDNIYLQWNKEGQRISQVVPLSATTIVNVENRNNNKFNFSLAQNYPNPFNPSTKIEYSIPHSSLVTLKVYDILGREVATLVNAEKQAGVYKVNFDGNGLSSGVYFYRIEATPVGGQSGNFVETKKLVLIK